MSNEIFFVYPKTKQSMLNFKVIFVVDMRNIIEDKKTCSELG